MERKIGEYLGEITKVEEDGQNMLVTISNGVEKHILQAKKAHKLKEGQKGSFKFFVKFVGKNRVEMFSTYEEAEVVISSNEEPSHSNIASPIEIKTEIKKESESPKEMAKESAAFDSNNKKEMTFVNLEQLFNIQVIKAEPDYEAFAKLIDNEAIRDQVITLLKKNDKSISDKAVRFAESAYALSRAEDNQDMVLFMAIVDFFSREGKLGIEKTIVDSVTEAQLKIDAMRSKLA